MPLSEDERQKQRRAAADREREEKEMIGEGVKLFGFQNFDLNDIADMDEVEKCAAMARIEAKKFIAVKVQDEHGKPVELKDRIGREDTIFMQLLMFRFARRAQQGRASGT